MYKSHKHSSRPTLVYHYFNARGRGETARQIAVQGELEWKDNRVENWPEVKESFPSQRLPVLEVNEVKVDQSLAINRYLAREAELAGKSPLETLQVDSTAESVNEVREKFIDFMTCKDEELKKTKGEGFNTFADEMLGRLETQLKNNNEGKDFLVGEKISWADIHLSCSHELFSMANPDILKNFPLLDALVTRVKEQPKIAEYLKTRPETKF